MCDVTQGVVDDALCDVTQGVVVSDEDLRRTFLQPEEAGPQQQGEEPVDGLRHPDLLGNTPELTLRLMLFSLQLLTLLTLQLLPSLTLQLLSVVLLI